MPSESREEVSDLAINLIENGFALKHHLTRRLPNSQNNEHQDFDHIHHASSDQESQNKFAVYSHYFFSKILLKYSSIIKEKARDTSELADILEDLYRDICDARLSIAKKTAKNLKIPQESIDLLSYQKLNIGVSTKTQLSGNFDYQKYIQELATNSKKYLHINSCLIALNEEKIDSDILIGSLERDSDGVVTHNMNLHNLFKNPNSIIYTFEPQFMFNETKKNQTKVNEITALAFKKALGEDNQDKALKYALVFNVLRGYNLRNVIGACWAQEISAKILFNLIGQPYFNKMPGVFLDIEACCEDNNQDLDKLSKMMDRQVFELRNKDNQKIERRFFDYNSQELANVNSQIYLDVMNKYFLLEDEINSVSKLSLMDLIEKIESLENIDLEDLFEKDFNGNFVIGEIFKRIKLVSEVSEFEDFENSYEDCLYSVIIQNLFERIYTNNDEELCKTFKLIDEFLNFAISDLAIDLSIVFETMDKSQDFLVFDSYKTFVISQAIDAKDYQYLKTMIDSALFTESNFLLKNNLNLNILEYSLDSFLQDNNNDSLSIILKNPKLTAEVLSSDPSIEFENFLQYFVFKFNDNFSDPKDESKTAKAFERLVDILIESGKISEDLRGYFDENKNSFYDLAKRDYCSEFDRLLAIQLKKIDDYFQKNFIDPSNSFSLKSKEGKPLKPHSKEKDNS